jgi:hypothetical protein
MVGRIQVFADSSFEYAEQGDGRDAMLYPVELDSGELIDTVAWFPDRARKWFRWRLLGMHLGDLALRHAQFLQRPILLLETPADWVRSPAGSIVVIDWRCNLRALFGEVPEVRCASISLKRFLQQRLSEQVAPRFTIEVCR